MHYIKIADVNNTCYMRVYKILFCTTFNRGDRPLSHMLWFSQTQGLHQSIFLLHLSEFKAK